MYALMTLLAQTIEVGVTAAARGVGKARTKRAVQRAELHTCVDLVALTGAAGTAPPAEVNARAAGEPIIAPLSGAKCVWYVVRVYERFYAWRPGPLGPAHVERQITVAEQTGGRLLIRDATGEVWVDPAGADLSLGATSYSGFEGRTGDGTLLARVGQLLDRPVRARHQAMTIGFLVEEWIVRDGEELHVVGQPRTEAGDVVLGKPALRPFVIDKRAPTPVELSRSRD
ncbi:MAG: helicase [Actinomycetia bacterium]|nr:helicase [Actinomycetes bacterium]